MCISFQELLQSHRDIIKDINEIQCGKDEETTHHMVLTLRRSDVCKLPTQHTIQPIDILNIVLSITIILIIVKLSYDCYNFRVYGHLPWIVMKLPF